MTVQEKAELKQTIDELPDDMSMEEFAEDLLLSQRAMASFLDTSGKDLTTDELLAEIDSWS